MLEGFQTDFSVKYYVFISETYFERKKINIDNYEE